MTLDPDHSGRLLRGLLPAPSDPGARARDVAAADRRPDRLDLTGAQALAQGQAPPLSDPLRIAARRLVAMPMVPAHQRRFWSPTGDPAFHLALTRLVLGPAPPLERMAMATVQGGAPALAFGLAAIRAAHGAATLWLPAQGAARYDGLARAAGLSTRSYRYALAGADTVAGEAMRHDLALAAPGDVVLLQACCHDPTGLDLPPDHWAALAGLCQERALVPFVECAGFGLGAGIEADTDGLQGLLMALPEAIVAISTRACLGLQGDDAGLLLVQGEGPRDALRAQELLAQLGQDRGWAPPEHAPALVTEILDSGDLRQMWVDDLRQRRMALAAARAALAAALEDALPTLNWRGLAQGRGLFACLPLGPEARAQLRETHAIHLSAEGRINISALPQGESHRLAAILAEVGLPEAAPMDPETRPDPAAAGALAPADTRSAPPATKDPSPPSEAPITPAPDPAPDRDAPEPDG